MLSLLVTNWKDESPHFTLQRPLEQRAGSTVEEAQSFAVWLSWNMVEMFSKRIWGINKFALMVISVIWCFKYHLAGQLLTCPLLTTRWFCTHLRCFLILDFSSAFVICQADALWVSIFAFIWTFYTQLINFTLPPLLPLTDQIPVRLYQTRNFNQYQIK